MLLCFATVFFIQYIAKDTTIIENLWVSMLILTISVVLTAFISVIYKNMGETHVDKLE